MRLYLVQHGHAVPKDVDPERPLSEQGGGDVRRVAEFLGRSGVRVAAVLHSGKTRARETARILAGAVCEEGPEAREGLGPGDAVEPVAKEAETWTQDTMLVGHLPYMAKLASLLLAGGPDADAVAYRPGSVVCLERSDEGGWRLTWMVRPELLPD